MIEPFIKYLTQEKRYSPHTIKAYTKDLGQFITYLNAFYEGLPIDRAKHTHIRSWMVELVGNEVTSKSINRKLSSLRTYYKYMKRGGFIDYDPMLKILPPKNGKKLPAIIQEKSLDNLLKLNDERPNTYAAHRDALIIELLYTSGLRRSELISVLVTDIDFSNKWIKVLGKGAKERILPISDAMLDSLLDYLQIRQDQFEEIDIDQSLFLTDKGKPLYPKFVYNLVHRHISKVSTAKKRSPHILRHSFATHMMNNGADLNAVKELLGHSSLAATQVYTHNSIQKLKETYKTAHPKGLK
jgi:integrase/recombinase XerC